jgi:hypothetical protein
MNAFMMAFWLSLPIAPLNPVEQDTLASMNLHLAASVAIPNGIVSAGPEVSAMYEMLVIHPFVIRGGVDLKYCRMTSSLFPKGNLLSLPLSADAIYYRGTDHLTGYLGFGGMYAINSFSPTSATIDSLMQAGGFSDVDLRNEWGYRLTLGLRYKRCYSLELSVSEIYPEFIFRGSGPAGENSRSMMTTRVGGVRLSIGYVFPIREY